jgi:hypothetical protein
MAFGQPSVLSCGVVTTVTAPVSAVAPFRRPVDTACVACVVAGWHSFWDPRDTDPDDGGGDPGWDADPDPSA